MAEIENSEDLESEIEEADKFCKATKKLIFEASLSMKSGNEGSDKRPCFQLKHDRCKATKDRASFWDIFQPY